MYSEGEERGNTDWTEDRKEKEGEEEEKEKGGGREKVRDSPALHTA